MEEKVDEDVEPFGKYKVAKTKITIDFKTNTMNKKRKEVIKILEKALGEGSEK